jgi:hypothetical protein
MRPSRPEMTMVRLPAFLLAFAVLSLSVAAPASAQSEEEVYAEIESLHGDADGFFEVFSLIQEAMQFGDPVTVAANAAYPLTVQANGEVYDLFSETDLLDNYDALVMVETQNAVANQDVDDLIVTSDGVGLANGAMWLGNICLNDNCSETYWAIIAINN